MCSRSDNCISTSSYVDMQYINELLEFVMERERERVHQRKYTLYFYDFCPVPVLKLHHLTLTVWSAANSLPSYPALPTLVSLVMRFSLVSLTWGKMGWQAMTCGSGMAFHKTDSWWQLLSIVHARWTEKLPEVPSFDVLSSESKRLKRRVTKWISTSSLYSWMQKLLPWRFMAF